MQIFERLKIKFQSNFGEQPDGYVKAPGRVCMMGEHTDYNQGYVLTCGLDLVTVVAFRPRTDSLVRVRSLEYPGYEDSFDLSKVVARSDQDWANYIRGVFYIIMDYGFSLKYGLDLLISSTLPLDAGLASSAAMSTAIAGSITKAFNLPLDKRTLALIAVKAENEFYGRACGIMDPLTAMLTKIGHLLLINCEDFSTKLVPFPEDMSIIIFNTGIQRIADGGGINSLRADCEQAARIMNVQSLRYATLEMLHENRGNMDETHYQRAYHVITEIERTLALAQAFEKQDLSKVYLLMRDSNDSLKTNFNSTIPETDCLVELCYDELDGNIGARMTGGGYGGSVVAVCAHDKCHQVSENVKQKYLERFEVNIPSYICRPAEGMQISWDK